ncbi:MAG: PhnD/SsuA/transferrin family substrate-binding protein [Kiritimatiellae bacterium]|nr:PhnD/SsuA/transferrin family substrate-binding protein [Kiritimatiellia bacterium]
MHVAAGLLIMTAVACGARPIPIVLPTQGEDLRNAPFLEKTAAYLSRQLPGHEFIVNRAGVNWVNQVDKTGPGLVFVDPVQFIQLESRVQLRPLAALERFAQTRRARQTGGVVFTLKDSAVQQTGDLQRATVAAVDGDPLASSLSVLRELKAQGTDSREAFGKLIMNPNDQAVVEVVLAGQADAGIVTAGVLEQMAAAGRLDLNGIRVLALGGPPPADYPFRVSTRLYPDRLLVALPGTDSDLADQVAALLLTAGPGDLDPDGAMDTGWTVPDPREEVRQLLRELQRPPYEDYGRLSFGTVLRQYIYWFIGAGALFVILALILSYVTSLNRALGEEVEERKEAQRSLESSIERFEHIASCSGDWIWETDHEERFTYSNAALKKLLGWPPRELIGKPIFELLSSAEKEKVGERKKILSTDTSTVFHRRITLLTADGRVAVHECTAGPVRNKKGEITGFRGINRDVTAEARMVSFR